MIALPDIRDTIRRRAIERWGAGDATVTSVIDKAGVKWWVLWVRLGKLGEWRAACWRRTKAELLAQIESGAQ